MQVQERVWPSGAVHDTVRAVLRDAAFRRSAQASIADHLMVQLLEWLTAFMRVVRGLPSMRAIAVGVVALIVLFVVVRSIMLARARDEAVGTQRSRRGVVHADDPWTLAERLVAEGRHEEAAHALYRAVITAVARSERLRMDPSKTSGDYARELRRRGASSLTAFRAFTRRFDAVVYGNAGATAAHLHELRALSAPFRPVPRAA